MNLDEKIREAQDFVTGVLTDAKKPVMACSFGKDSMVMLDLVRRMGHKLPVLYWRREHFFQQKNQFANAMIEKYDLAVYDYPPLFTKAVKQGDVIEVVNYYQIGKDKNVAVPSGIISPQNGEPYLCALQDMYLKPTGSFNFPWDCILVGHKSTDVDPLQGNIPLKTSLVKAEGTPDICFPIRFFTDEDVWAYTKKFDVPQDMNRYKPDGEDMKFNNDYYPACTACMNPDRADTVWCPKYNQPIPNISKKLNWVDADSLRHPYWGERGN